MADSGPRVTRGNNTTVSSASLNPESAADSKPPPKGQRRRHEHIRTSDEEMKEFNKSYYAKERTQYLDPCRAQTVASLKCMDQNNYDKRRCTRFFKDYSDCKKQWMASLREERRRKNLGIVDDDEVETPATKQESTTSKPLS
ncbi:Mitochondrial copper homeostasis protein [Mortierella sp. NVP85]|nr:Mitochondrial copper homeostasis protein [Mortierella sp. NVP85]